MARKSAPSRLVGIAAAALMLLAAGSTVFAGPGTVATKAPAGMKIDGGLDEWSNARAIVLDSVAQLVPEDDPLHWTGPDDLSAKLYVMYDNKYIYLGANVTDQAVIQEFYGENIWQGDCMEVYLDTDPSDAGEAAYSADDWQIGVTPGTGAVAPAYFIWKQVGDRSIDGIQCAARKTSAGYTLEAAIPLAGLSLVPKVGQQMGFDIAVGDADTLGTAIENQIILSGNGNGWQDPNDFVSLKFE